MDRQPDLHTTPAPVASWPSPPPPAPTTNRIFVGRFGLRAGWSIAIFIPLFLLLSVILGITAMAATGKLKHVIADRAAESAARHSGKPLPPHKEYDQRPKSAAINEALQFAGVALATLILALIERRRIAVYGLGRYRILDILPGAFWGVAALSLLVAVLHAAHLLVFDSQALHGAAIYLFAAKWLLAFLLVGLFEEYFTRGFLQYTLTRGLIGLAEKISPNHVRAVAFWMAAIIMSILFGALHLGNAGENRVGIVMVFCAGILFSYALWRTGSLWWAIGFHMAWDWSQSFLYGVPDSGALSAGRLFLTHPIGKPLLSGGVDGPEGSLYVLPTLLLVALIIRFTTKAGAQPPLGQSGVRNPIPAQVHP